jgi:hypothetical protein
MDIKILIFKYVYPMLYFQLIDKLQFRASTSTNPFNEKVVYFSKKYTPQSFVIQISLSSLRPELATIFFLQPASGNDDTDR